MIRSNLPARLRCAAALILTYAFALAFTGKVNAATDTPQPPAVPAVAQTIEADLDALEALVNQSRPEGFEKMTPDQQQQFRSQHNDAISKKAFAIYNTYKDDPRRWDAVPYYVNIIGGAEYESRIAKIETDMAAAGDVPAGVHELVATRSIFYKLFLAREAADKKQTPAPDITVLRAAVDAYLAAWPNLGNHGPEIVRDYVGLERQLRGTTEAEVVKTFAQSPNAAVKKYAQKRLAFLDAAKKPIEMTFTAADGREVDLAKLRGKVVLIDFWATWCGACIESLPDVKALYSKYHDKGLEIIGIALEDAHLSPKKDSHEQTEKKLADAKKALLAFVEKEQMPWPQYFDGKFWATDYAAKYYIRGVPAMFILGKDGILALESSTFTEVNSEDLEKEVKRLLAL